MERTRLRIRFTKTGDLRWISHRDLARVWERLLRRANLQMAFTEGFHPKPRINFPSALALGVEALEELVELEIVGEFDLADIRENIEAEMPEGMSMISIESPDYGLGKAKVVSATYRIAVPAEQRESVQKEIDGVFSEGQIVAEREKRTVTQPVDDEEFELRLEDEYLIFAIPHDPSGSLRPTELLERVGLGELLETGEVLQRCQVKMRDPKPKTPTQPRTQTAQE